MHVHRGTYERPAIRCTVTTISLLVEPTPAERERWRGHAAIVERPESRVPLAARLVLDATASGERVLLVHGGGLEGAELTVTLEERGVGLQAGTVELQHRSGFPAAATAAAGRTRAASAGPLRVIVLDDGGQGTGCVPCRPWNHLGESASLTCVFDVQPVTLHCLPRLLAHDHVTIDGVTLELGSPANQFLVVDFLWESIRRDEELERAARAATSAGLPRDLVETFARRRRTHIADRRATAAARGELTRMRRRAERAEAEATTRESVRHALRDAGGDLDSLLQVTATTTGAVVVLEDPSFRLLRWAAGTDGDHETEPRALADVLTPGRLHRLAAELAPGRVSPVPLGPPAAGTRLVMRLGASTLGYLAVAEWSATDSETAALWLHQLEAPFVVALQMERDRARLAADLTRHIVRLLALGTLPAADAVAAAEHAGWHRGRGARMAAVLPTAPSGDPNQLEDLCRLAHAAGLAAASHDGYLAVLLTSDVRDVEQLRGYTDDVPSIVVGLGATVTEPTAATRSFREAAWAARMAAVSAKRILHFDDLGVHRLLMPGAEVGDPALEAPIQRLEAAASNLGFDPVETLSVYLDAGASPAEAARRLHVHVNSMRYRLERVAQIAELDLSDPEQRFRVQLALRIRASRLFLRSRPP